jgi:uncharacterized phiE125 gp8 family phage protein
MGVSYPARSTGWRAPPHMTAVLVTPAVAIVSSSIAAATVLETATPHGLVSGDTVAIAGHAGSTPAVDGARIVTVIDATHVSVPVTVTIAGAGGTVTRTSPVEPLTLAQGKLRAGLDWADGDPRDALMLGFLAMARSQVQHDTGVVPLLQTYDVYFDALPPGRMPIALPWRPVAAVTSVQSIDSAEVLQTLAVANYTLDPGSEQPTPARVALSEIGVWPTDLRSFQPYVLRIVVGFASVALIPPWFVHAVGLLTAHYATLGRDLASADPATAIPFGYAETIAPYQLVTLA